ncbi:MAG: MBL fold metallo-hydrolase [Promethearchaeota archaeon]
MKITRIRQSCFILEEDNIVIYMDPFKLNNHLPKADVILISHPHFDHADIGSMKKIMNENTIIFCSASAKKILKNLEATPIVPGEIKQVNGHEIQAVNAYNLKRIFHPKKKKWLGFIISIGKWRIYHAGDTDFIPEMNEIKNITHALLPIGGTFTMTPKEAIGAIKAIEPENVIPMHERGFDLEKFKNLVKSEVPEVNVILLKPGDEILL